MADPNSKSAIVKAIVGNAIITIAKGVAAAMSGSGAMFAETIHSLVDTLNQGLMLIGQKRAVRPANDRFPYGFGPEGNFWCLLASIGVFIFGGGMTLQHGLHAIADPHMPQRITLVMIILIFATLIEGAVCISVFRGVARTRDAKPWGKHLRAQNVATIAVLLEDTAAVIGCLIAMAAIGLCVATENGIYDAIAQILIGLMLAAVGIILIRINWAMLIGKAVDPDLHDQIQTYLNDLNGIDHVTNLKTRQLTSDTFMLKAELVFSGGEIAGKLIEQHLEKTIDAAHPESASEALGRFADQLFVEQAKRVDDLEAAITKHFPGAIYIDLEPHLRDESSGD